MTHGYKAIGYGLKLGCLQLKRGWLALLILNAVAIDTLAAASPESFAPLGGRYKADATHVFLFLCHRVLD